MRSFGVNVSLKVSLCTEVGLVIKAKLVWPVKRNLCLSVCFAFLFPAVRLLHTYDLSVASKHMITNNV